MKILLASSEIHPYSKTGGLADMVGTLGRALAHAGHQVGMVTPLYRGIRERLPDLKQLDYSLEVPLGAHKVRGTVWQIEGAPNLAIYFVDHAGFFDRPGLYQADNGDYPDNAERFIFFSKAVAHLALYLPWQPEILHVNDWQTAAAALLLHQHRRQAGAGQGPRTCLSIHNLAYQGLFPRDRYGLMNLPPHYFSPSGVEFYGQLGCLKAGIAYADAITTVSPRYAREILTEECGCGLDGLLRSRQANLYGILNGVDYEEWDPSADSLIAQTYSRDQMEGKSVDKHRLQEEFGLPTEPKIPLFGNIGRLADQKGVELLIGALHELLQFNVQFVLLGSGNPVFQRAYEELAQTHPTKVAVRFGYDESLSHRIEAGSDFFVMPSRFEPCGLSQLYSLRYATIPIVRATGGLDDTVIDIREDQQRATGIKFHEYSISALAKAFYKAIALYNEPELFEHFRWNAMSADFSEERTAAEYAKVYENLLARTGK